MHHSPCQLSLDPVLTEPSATVDLSLPHHTLAPQPCRQRIQCTQLDALHVPPDLSCFPSQPLTAVQSNTWQERQTHLPVPASSHTNKLLCM